MKKKYEFKAKALDFATQEGYDSVKVRGLYQDFEVYTPYCKCWKANSPVIGLPQLILVNEKEVKWDTTGNPFSILHSCKKIPSLIFEYDHKLWFGTSYNISLYSDGTLIKTEYGYSKLGPEWDRIRDDVIREIVCDKKLAAEIKQTIKGYKEQLRQFPRKVIYNLDYLDQSLDFIKFGSMKFEGVGMFYFIFKKTVEFYKEYESDSKYQYYCRAWEFQKIFLEVKKTIDKYCSENIWRGYENITDIEFKDVVKDLHLDDTNFL